MSKQFTAPKNFKLTSDTNRILAIILTVASILSLFLPITAVYETGMKTGFFTLFTANAVGMVGVVSTIMRFGFIFLMIATAILSILAIVKPLEQNSFFPLASLLFLIGTGAYSLSVMACSLSFKYFAVDVVTLILSLGGLVVYGMVSLEKDDELFFKNFLQFALTLGYTILMSLSLGSVLNEKGFLGILVLVLTVLTCANMIYECIRLQKENDSDIDKIRFYVAIGAAALLFLITLIGTSTISGILLSLLAIGFALGEMEMVNSKLRSQRRKEVYTRPQSALDRDTDNRPMAMPYPFTRPMPSPMAAAVSPNTNLNGFRFEEYAEAMPYEGGPITGVEMAEEVNPTFAPNSASENQVNTAGYDFYNSKSFDPFIASLNNEERNQFTELFILKYKGVMPELPDYEVGGDNKEFFRKLFIYLGQYRDRISSELLAKIYNYSIKL